MMDLITSKVNEITYREVGGPKTGDDGPAPVALGIHGFPTSSYLWRHVLPRAADVGWRAIAPDLPGFGDSRARRPGTWEQQVANLSEFHSALGLSKVVLMVHDWGGLIGLRWACDNPSLVAGLVVMDTGFSAKSEWHDLALLLRTPDEGEQFVDSITKELFALTMRQTSPDITAGAIAEYWKAFGDEDRRRSILDLYRSGDFEKLIPYNGRLAELKVPSLLLWGANDPYVPPAGAHWFEHHLVDTRKVVVFEDAGHFVLEDKPQAVADEIASFLSSI